MDTNLLIKKTELFVLDMDGTFYLGDKMIPGSDTFLKKVVETGKRYIFFTNNSSKNKTLYVDKLAKMGVNITKDMIYTSGDVTQAYLNRFYPGKSVCLLGTKALYDSFRAYGINVNDDPAAPADIVVCAFDMELTYERLRCACDHIRNGAVYIATHPDINCPTEAGFIPDCGAMIAAINLSTGKTPRILGKPYPETVEMISEICKVPKENTAFVGDRLYTDVACGVKNGALGFLVLSGEATLSDIEESDVKPHAVFKDLKEISTYL
ncbi:MAG: HAD-IIA family hydrolase [Lachnospiraceae bacterium]|nr:HAD-IIA family hydrolase [Lachnospiraceae bacterium]